MQTLFQVCVLPLEYGLVFSPFRVANEHRPVNRPRQFDKRVTCPPEMVEIAEQFAEMALESRRTVEEDDVVVCVDRPTRTVCDDLIE